MTAINARIPRSEITAPIINRSLSCSLYRTAHWRAASMLLKAYVAPVLGRASEQQSPILHLISTLDDGLHGKQIAVNTVRFEQ
jgi:hypothetical protein